MILFLLFHSTETALLSVTNDILNSMGKGNVTALTLLDLSAALILYITSCFWTCLGSGSVFEAMRRDGLRVTSRIGVS